MITINLLPKDRRKAASNWLFNVSVAFITLLIVVAAVGGSMVANLMVLSADRELRGLQKELDARSEVMDLVSQLEDYKKLLDQKQGVIDALVTGRIEWGQKLHELAQIVPENVWLERLQLETVMTKVKVEEPPSKTTSKSRSTAAARPKFNMVRTDYLHIYAVSNDLKKKSFIIGDFIDRIRQNESFYSAFTSVDFQEGEQQNWIERDKESPPVWRFRLTLKLRDHTPKMPVSSGGSSEDNEVT